MGPLYALSIGVDFGVSTSGISYCLTGPDEQTPPPESVFFPSGEALEPSALGNIDRPDSWGSGIAADEDKFTLFKLSLLHPNALRQSHPQHPERLVAVKEAISRLDLTGKSGVDVVAEYLRRLWAAAAPRLSKELQRKQLGPADVDIRFTFSIPAVWGEDTASRMREAINTSHILQASGKLPASLSLITEPEAAAIAALPRIAENGGLKDVISYDITSIKPLAVRESVCGEGQLLGDMFMRSALEVLIKDSIPGYATNTHLNIDRIALGYGIETAWKKIREQSSDKLRAASWSYRFGFRYVGGNTEHTVSLPGRDIARAFQTVTDDILALTQRQVDAVKKTKGRQPDLIVVVGGFGRNRFLQSELSGRFGEHLVAFTDSDGQLAVKHGAAMAGILGNPTAIGPTADERPSQAHPSTVPPPIRIQSRIARYSYGYHDPSGPNNNVHWFISEGQHVAVDYSATFTLPKTAFATTFGNQPCAIIYCTPLPMPPVSTMTGHEPVTQACRVTCERSDVLGQMQSVSFSLRLRGAGMQLRVNGPEDLQHVALKVLY